MIRTCRDRWSWRRFNGWLVLAMLALWLTSWQFDFIGNTKFIGHVSMLALVLAAWAGYRADVPVEETEQ
jgi:hypothetical protein